MAGFTISVHQTDFAKPQRWEMEAIQPDWAVPSHQEPVWSERFPICVTAGHFNLHFLPSFGDFLGENTCLFLVLMLFTWTVVNHQGRLEMHARICTGGPKTEFRGFHRLWPGCVSILYLHLLQR